jgi:transposase-like protein
MEDARSESATINGNGRIAGDMAVYRRPASPAANAVRHGLSAKKFVPQVLGPELLDNYRAEFCAEWKPRTPTERHLVDELCRHAAALARAEEIEGALLRASARGLAFPQLAADEAELHDEVLAAAVGADPLDRLTRYRRAHERAFLATHERLIGARGQRESQPSPTASSSCSHIGFDEAACRDYLRRRWETGESVCPACRGRKGTWLPNRDVWRCQDCRRQTGLRSGTVMAQSALPFPIWFAAIAAICLKRDISTEELARVTGIRREKTVRTLQHRIRRALDSPDAERQLAGLSPSVLKQLATRVG